MQTTWETVLKLNNGKFLEEMLVAHLHVFVFLSIYSRNTNTVLHKLQNRYCTPLAATCRFLSSGRISWWLTSTLGIHSLFLEWFWNPGFPKNPGTVSKAKNSWSQGLFSVWLKAFLWHNYVRKTYFLETALHCKFMCLLIDDESSVGPISRQCFKPRKWSKWATQQIPDQCQHHLIF